MSAFPVLAGLRELYSLLYVVTGVATAFATRDILGNMLSGFSLQFSRPFSVGDYIKVPGYLSNKPFAFLLFFLEPKSHDMSAIKWLKVSG